MWDKVKPYIYGVLVLALLYFGYRAWAMYREYQQLKLEHQIAAQNLQAAKDESVSQMAKITFLSAYVRNLQNDSTKLAHKYVALRTMVSVLVDSLHDVIIGTVTVQDTKVRVNFEGNKSIAHYKGFTLGDAATKTGSVDISIDFPRPIDIKSEVQLDKGDGKWKIYTQALTPLVKVKGVGVIDEAIFAAMQKYTPPEPQRWLGISVSATAEYLYGGALFRIWKDAWVGGGYKLNNHDREWYKNAKVDALWTPF